MEHKDDDAKVVPVNINGLAAKRGLRVWISNRSDGYWCPECGEFEDTPKGWRILPKGDASLTRRIRKGPHWVMLVKANAGRKWFTEEVGTMAPGDAIDDAYEELGGESGAITRSKGKEDAQEKREAAITHKLEAAIIRLYPAIPAEDVKAILGRSRTSGHVGTAPWLYFQSAEKSQDALDEAAKLAVRAHVRHRYTDYDDRLFDAGVRHEAIPDDSARRQAREEVADRINEVLSSWRP